MRRASQGFGRADQAAPNLFQQEETEAAGDEYLQCPSVSSPVRSDLTAAVRRELATTGRDRRTAFNPVALLLDPRAAFARTTGGWPWPDLRRRRGPAPGCRRCR